MIKKTTPDYTFEKRSIYQRKYHYEKKINKVSKRLHLTDDEKYDLYNKLMAIDNHAMEILNKQFCRKRMISIFYLIKKFLEQMGNEKYKLFYLKISEQTLANCEKWWKSYKNNEQGVAGGEHPPAHNLCEITSKQCQLDSQVLQIL